MGITGVKIYLRFKAGATVCNTKIDIYVFLFVDFKLFFFVKINFYILTFLQFSHGWKKL